MTPEEITTAQRAFAVLASAPTFSDAALGDRIDGMFPDLTFIERKMIYDEAGRLRDEMRLPVETPQ